VCLPLFSLVLLVIMSVEVVFLFSFWCLSVFLLSPLWVLARIPITMLCPLYYESHIKTTCWNRTFGCGT
jgi:hypothetical protein